MNINNLINKTDKNMRNMYNMFSFIDSAPDNYSSVNQYQENLPFLFSSFQSIIQSEDSSCNITSEDRMNYDDKLVQLENILNNCNNAPNKQECLYDKFNDDMVVNLINDLTNIITRIDRTCIYNNITPSEEENMCSNSNNILNNYNTEDLRKVSLFFAKYSSIIKNLKNVADNNVYDYLNKCGKDTRKLESYNRAQNVLANTLFQLGNINNIIQNIIQNTNVANTNVESTTLNSNYDNSTLNATQTTFNTCINNPEISERITDLNNQIIKLTTNNAILNDKIIKIDKNTKNDNLNSNNDYNNNNNNNWIYIIFMSIFVIIIIVLIYVIMRRRTKTVYTTTSDYISPSI